MPAKHRKVALMGYRSVGKCCHLTLFEPVCDEFSGKSSLAVQYIEKRWNDHYDPTVENSELNSLPDCVSDVLLFSINEDSED